MRETIPLSYLASPCSPTSLPFPHASCSLAPFLPPSFASPLRPAPSLQILASKICDDPFRLPPSAAALSSSPLRHIGTVLSLLSLPLFLSLPRPLCPICNVLSLLSLSDPLPPSSSVSHRHCPFPPLPPSDPLPPSPSHPLFPVGTVLSLLSLPLLLSLPHPLSAIGRLLSLPDNPSLMLPQPRRRCLSFH